MNRQHDASFRLRAEFGTADVEGLEEGKEPDDGCVQMGEAEHIRNPGRDPEQNLIFIFVILD